MPLPELELIKRVRERSNHMVTRRSRARALAAGIGDDCAVLRFKSGQEILVTTDFSLENVHFRRQWHPAEVVGHRCLARGLSDIAAMGGWPVAVFLSLAVPQQVRQRWVDDFLRGFVRLANRFGVVLAGGDTAQSPDGVLADIVVVGSVPNKRAVLRSKARPGDLIYVTGKLGESASVLERLRAAPRAGCAPKTIRRIFIPHHVLKQASTCVSMGSQRR